MVERKPDVKIEPEEDLEYYFHHEVKLETETEIGLPIKSEFKESLKSCQQQLIQPPPMTFPFIQEHLNLKTEIDFPIKSKEVFKQEIKQQEENETSSLTYPPIKEEFEEKEVRKNAACSMQHSCCQNPTVAPILQTSTPCTSSVLKVLKCPAKSCSDNLLEAALSSKKYNEELKQMWEVHKKKLENENLLFAACVKRLHLIQLERERVIQERKSLAIEQARLKKRSAQIDVEMKELDLAITKSQ